MKKWFFVFVLILIVLLAIFFMFKNLNNSNNLNILKNTEVGIDLSFVENVEKMNVPTFQNNVCDISQYGAVKITENKENNNVEAVKKAIESCVNKGGGTVKIPAGEWFFNGPIHLKSNINLFLEENAVLTFSSNPNDYLPVVKTRYEGIELMNFSPMIYAQDCENIAITGKGTIQKNENLNGWDGFKKGADKTEKKLYKMSFDDVALEERVFGKIEDSLRVSFIQPYNCKNVLIEGVTIKDGPMWTIHPLYVENLIIRNVKIQTSQSNTDGIAIDSCQNVLIENNKLSTGDDSIVLKSGKDKDGWRVGKPSQNIVIRNNEVSESHGAVTIGSEMSGDVRNVLVENLDVKKADQGIRIKSREGRGGIIENIIVRNVSIQNTKESIQINFNYGSKSNKPKTTKKPIIRNVKISDIKIENGGDNIIDIVGLSDSMENILFQNIQVNNENSFINIEAGENLSFENVNSSLFKIKNSKDIQILSDICPEIQKENSKNIVNSCGR